MSTGESELPTRREVVVASGPAASGPSVSAAMRLDVVTIFPEYLAPLDLSLIGKARAAGLLDIHVHDLRRWTHDRHNTVDDTPYGGGAGMVMKPQPWAEALDHVVSRGAELDAGEPEAGAVPARTGASRPVLIVPGPGGVPFTQSLARELAQEPWLAFACGRYEGIDERVYDHAREDLGLDVRIVSLGDYVLNGGEVAVLAMTEAIARLVPGVIGNEESLVEESHEDGLLEYPVYTKPAAWTARTPAGDPVVRDVPAVLLSGNHAAIAQWRGRQRLERTAARRPDLLHPAQALDVEGMAAQVHAATAGDVGEILTLLLAAWAASGSAASGSAAPDSAAPGTAPVGEPPRSTAEVLASLEEWTTVVARAGGRLVAVGRARLEGDTWLIEPPVVAPDLAGHGVGRWLRAHLEQLAPVAAVRLRLDLPAGDRAEGKVLRKAGYRPVHSPAAGPREAWERRR